MKRILLTIVTMIFATTLVSCDKNENDDKLKEFTVFFETGDDDCMVVPQKVREGEKATKPDDPTRSGYTFMAWFKEAELTNEWQFNFDGVTSDMTLYAKWIECTVKEEDRITFTWQAETGVNKNVTVRATAGETFTVNWGDNSQIITETGLGDNNIILSHTYASTDEYMVTVTANTNCRFIYFNCSGFYGDWIRESNRIYRLTLTNCSDLKYLYCTLNQLTSLNLTGCSNLTDLDCGDNQLTDLTLTGCPNLIKLKCGDNQLTNLDLTGYPDLTELWCSNNQLTNLDLTGLRNLRTFFVGGNPLTNLDLKGCPDLTELYCMENKLTNLDVTGCLNLYALKCSYNQFTRLDLTGCPSLTILDCGYNQLTQLDLTGCPNLVSLACSYNRLTHLDLSNNTALQILHCYNNQLTNLDLTDCPALGVLWCFSNQLENLNLTGCSVLVNVFCNDNQLTNLNLTGCSSLQMLICYTNQLTSLNLNGYSTLQSLYCHNNQLTNLDLTGCFSLNELYCYNNNLQLSDLYAGHLLINYDFNKRLGGQHLNPQTALQGSMVDYSSEAEFNGISTVFAIEKNGGTAIINVDYFINNGKITFNKSGTYSITMTNSSIVSHSDFPAQVTATVNVLS